MSLSKEEIRVILAEKPGQVVARFKIEFRPRFALFDLGAENIIKLMRGAAATLSTWEIEEVAFLPVDDDPRGVHVTLTRIEPKFQTASILAVTAVAAFAVVAAAGALAYSVHRVTRLTPAGIPAFPIAGGGIVSSFKFASLALLLGVGFIIYKAVIK